VAGGVCVAAVLAGLALPSVAGSAPAVTAAGSGARPEVASTKVVTLVTGDQVMLTTRPGNRQTAAVKPRSARHDSFVTQRIGGDLYVLPAGAVPYLGRSLDLALFDVSALVRDNPDGRIPVRVGYAAGAAQTAPPGVTFTGTGTPSARDGYVTAGSAAEFGAALDAQRARDAAAHWAGDRRLYGAVTSIRYAGRGPATVIRPRFPMFTLQLPVLGTQGEPAPFALLDVVNVDDIRKFAAIPVVIDGDARVSVPAGHYAVSLIYPVFDATGETPTEIRFAMSEFEVTGATSHVLDARTATSQVSFRTPRPADLQSAQIAFFRGSDQANGHLFLVNAGKAPLFVAPAPAAAVGVRHYYAAGELTSPARAAAPYSYRVEYPTDGAIGDQRYVVTADSLATVTHVFYSEHRLTGAALTFAELPWLLTDFGVVRPLDLPQRHTQYVTASPEIRYSYIAEMAFDRLLGSFLQSIRERTYSPRAHYTEEWFRQPLAPDFTVPFNTGLGLLLCDACRNGDLLFLSLVPVMDSTPDHFGFLDFPDEPGVVSTSRLQLLSGSTVLADEQDTSEVLVPAPADAAPYRLVYDQTRRAPWFGLSPVSHTEWTFNSAHSGTRTIPAGAMCFGEDDTCSALSLPTLNYQLGTELSGAMRPGPATLRLSVGHTAFGPVVPVSSASVSVSFDGGKTWTPVVMRSLGGGAFQATWTNPASATGPVVLRVEAADAAGSTISQTVQQPFTITAGGNGA
jgi:hypothetical protein